MCVCARVCEYVKVLRSYVDVHAADGTISNNRFLKGGEQLQELARDMDSTASSFCIADGGCGGVGVSQLLAGLDPVSRNTVNV